MSAAKTSGMKAGEISIGEVARRTGVSTATINFYVKEGVLPPPRKLNRTRAAYDETHVRLLKIARRAVHTGTSLAAMRRYVRFWGTDEAGLLKLEGIGSLQPAERPWNDPQQEPLEHFEAEDRASLAARLDVDESILEQLEEWGVLKPSSAGGYRLSEAMLVLNVRALLREDLPLDRLAFLKDLAEAIVPAAEALAFVRSRHLTGLLDRTVRFRDLMAPLQALFMYMLESEHHRLEPGWRDRGLDLLDKRHAEREQEQAKKTRATKPKKKAATKTKKKAATKSKKKAATKSKKKAATKPKKKAATKPKKKAATKPKKKAATKTKTGSPEPR